MNGRQEAVMWIGLGLIVGNFFVKGGSSLSALFGGGPSGSGMPFGKMTPQQQVTNEQHFAASVSPQYGSSFLVPGSLAANAWTAFTGHSNATAGQPAAGHPAAGAPGSWQAALQHQIALGGY